MCSRALGADVEKIRDSISAGEVDCDSVGLIKGVKNHEKAELWQRSVVAIASSSLSSNQILECILAEGVNTLTIKPMGGIQHLISFESIEEKNEMIASQWLEKWFVAIRNVSSASASIWKEAWISVYGVPLFGWNYENFYNIGCVFGRVKSIDYSNYDCAKILVISDCLFTINCKMLIEIEEIQYKISISEDRKAIITCPISSPCEEPGSTSSDSKEAMANDPPSEPGSLSLDLHACKGISDISQSPQKDDQSNSSTFQLLPTHSSEPPSITPMINGPPSPKDFLNSPSRKSRLSSSQKIGDCLPFTSSILFEPPNLTRPLIIQSAPKKPSNLSRALSPTQTSNKFGPLRKTNASSSSSTSSLSGPFFPPGFEQAIAPPIRKAHARKRLRRLLRKKLNKPQNPKSIPALPSSPLANHPPLTQPQQPHSSSQISSGNIMKLAEEFGLTYEGSPSTLKRKIDEIIDKQFQDWVGSQL